MRGLACAGLFAVLASGCTPGPTSAPAEDAGLASASQSQAELPSTPANHGAAMAPTMAQLAGHRWLRMDHPPLTEAGAALPEQYIAMAEGTVSGYAGCNQFQGAARFDGSRWNFGPLAASKRACISDELMHSEMDFMRRLEAAGTLSLSGSRLQVGEGADGLVFERGAAL